MQLKKAANGARRERLGYFFKTVSEGSRHFHKMYRHDMKKIKPLKY